MHCYALNPSRLAIAATLFVAVSGAHADTLSFRQGVGGYGGTQDVHIKNFDPDANFGNQIFLDMQDDSRFVRRTLLRFDDIVGDGPSQIPPYSRIVSATLTLDSILASSTAGATMHRTRSDWSENTVTWNNFGIGDGGQPDVDFDSEILASFPLDTLGPRAIDVTQQMQGWVDGDAPLGWLFQGIAGNVGRVGSSEGSTGSRPLLQVEFTPVDATVLCLQQDLEGYGGTQDTHIQNFNPDSNFGNQSFLDVQDDGEFIRRTLIRFDDLVGSGAGQIPPASRILSADLIMDVTLAQSTAGATLHRTLVDWSESTVTWNSFGSGGGGQAGVDFGAEILATTSLEVDGVRVFDVTNIVQAYADGQPTYGWLFQGLSGNIGRFTSSEGSTTRRPILKVAYLGCGSDGCPADINGSGDVTFADLLQLLGAWGPCPDE